LAKTKAAKTARAAAAQVLSQVCQHNHALNGVLRHAQGFLPDNEKSLCQQLCYGVLRWKPQLELIVRKLLKKPLKNKDSDIHALLLLGLYQLREMRLPEHATLSETVNACKQLGKPWAKGLINGTLREYQRQQENLENQITQSDSAIYAHPDWLLEKFKEDWPSEWQTIVNENNQQPPMFIRVNQQKTSSQNYLEQLTQNTISATAIAPCKETLLLDKPIDVYQLPGFTEGHVSVQDGAAQLVGDILDIKPGQRVLDACAAPGGKTCHILEICPDNEIVALDIDPSRLEKIKQNTDRLKLNAKLKAADAADTESWWDGESFDRILIDAPCSGTGVIRRHPDIKHLRRSSDIQQLVTTQQQLLEKLWPLLKTGGLLVYTTCSIIKQENEQQVIDFLEKHPDASEIMIEPAPATRQAAGYQRLPGQQQMDGFFYACLQRR